jgi:hypothetical protein
MTSQASVAVVSDITGKDLGKVSHTKVFFGHQSVGMNILDGVGGVYAAHGMAAPVIDEGATDPGRDGFIDHAFIGENGNPLLKIQDFAAKLRSRLGQHVDVAMMKLCYVDVDSGTDADRLFATYRSTMAALQRPRDRAADDRRGIPVEAEEPSHRHQWRCGGQRGAGTAECPDPEPLRGRSPVRPCGRRVHRA